MTSTNRTPLIVAMLALTPWAWFLVRDLTPRADVVAIGMSVFLVVGLTGSVLLAGLARARRGATAGIVVSWLLFAAVVFLGPWTPRGSESPVEGVRLVAANVRGDRANPQALDDLLAQRGDVLVVSEMLPGLLRPLGEAYEHTAAGRGAFDVVVYSRWPLVPLEDAPSVVDRNGLAVEVQAPGGPFVLYALHLPRPAFPVSQNFQAGLRSHRRLIDDLIEAIEAEPRPVVVAGDLNLTDRGGGYRALADARLDAMRTGWTGPTSVRWWPLLLRIDHIFAPPEWCAADAERFAIADSDHKGVSTTIGPCA